MNLFFICIVLLYYIQSCETNSSSNPVNRLVKFYGTCALQKLVDGDKGYKANHFWMQLLKPILIQRTPGSEGNLKVRQHIKDVFADSPLWKVTTDDFIDSTPLGPTQFSNIIVTQQPEKLKKLTFACHYDSKIMKGVFVAATDSAVPCAMMLNLALNLDYWLKLGQGSQAEDYSLRFLFLDGEEAFVHWTATDSIYGSRHLAELWESEPDNVDPSMTKLQTIEPFVLLDLIGEQGMKFGNYFSETSSLFKQLKDIETKLHNAKLLLDNHRMFTNAYLVDDRYRIQDDHIPFLHRHVPVLHLIVTPFPSTWHSTRDNEANLSPTQIDNLNKILRVFVAQLLHLKVSSTGCKKNLR